MGEAKPDLVQPWASTYHSAIRIFVLGVPATVLSIAGAVNPSFALGVGGRRGGSGRGGGRTSRAGLGVGHCRRADNKGSS